MEPYSIAMTVADVLPDFQKWDIRILATDIDHEMIEHGPPRHLPLPQHKHTSPSICAIRCSSPVIGMVEPKSLPRSAITGSFGLIFAHW